MKQLGRMWNEHERGLVFAVLEALAADHYIIPKSEMNPLKEQAEEALQSLEEWLGKQDNQPYLEHLTLSLDDSPTDPRIEALNLDMGWWKRPEHQPNHIADFHADKEGSNAEEE